MSSPRLACSGVLACCRLGRQAGRSVLVKDGGKLQALHDVRFLDRRGRQCRQQAVASNAMHKA
eukprot:scaffold112175_cov33-Tisochrysis_lutea.AAC.2